MDSSRSSSFRLLSLSPIELRDEVDEVSRLQVGANGI